MAKGEKTGGRDFKKGESGNPNGRPLPPADIRAAREFDQLEFERIARALMKLPKDELNAILKDKAAPAQTVMIGRIVRTAMWSSDHKRLDFLMTRLIGRPKPYIPPDEAPRKSGPEDLTDEELEKRLKGFQKKSRKDA